MRILIATDGELHSDKAVEAGGRLAEFSGGLITLLTVIKSEQDTNRAALILQQARDLLPSTVMVLNWRTRCGQVAEQIVNEAKSGKYDLIVMGYQSTNRFLRHILAPTTDRVLEHAPCPVLIVKSNLVNVLRLLVCESGHEPTLLERLQNKLPIMVSATIDYTVLHVMSQMVAAPSVPEWGLHASAKELIAQGTPEGALLDFDSRLLSDSNAHSRVKIRHGAVVDEILAEAENGRYDAIVIGRHQQQGWQSLLLDDIAKMIIEQVNLSVLIL